MALNRTKINEVCFLFSAKYLQSRILYTEVSPLKKNSTEEPIWTHIKYFPEKYLASTLIDKLPFSFVLRKRIIFVHTHSLPHDYIQYVEHMKASDNYIQVYKYKIKLQACI